mmetsp:Transcript_15731/g.34018  ORF Transcript_15731/g.34018 Transcript_15731/m.34018 type:complete len:240 (-) Transcript_15731:1030-1749(-)
MVALLRVLGAYQHVRRHRIRHRQAPPNSQRRRKVSKQRRDVPKRHQLMQQRAAPHVQHVRKRCTMRPDHNVRRVEHLRLRRKAHVVKRVNVNSHLARRPFCTKRLKRAPQRSHKLIPLNNVAPSSVRNGRYSLRKSVRQEHTQLAAVANRITRRNGVAGQRSVAEQRERCKRGRRQRSRRNSRPDKRGPNAGNSAAEQLVVFFVQKHHRLSVFCQRLQKRPRPPALSEPCLRLKQHRRR